jgi:hypothetical protein
MMAKFDLAGDLKVSVEKVHGGIALRVYEGAEYERPLHERAPTSQIVLSKGQARAIASAIMGCAAEV